MSIPRDPAAEGAHLLASLEDSLRQLRTCWPTPWPGLGLVFERCARRLGWQGGRLPARTAALHRCAVALAAQVEADGHERALQDQEPRYHNRLHIADTLVCMTHLLLAQRVHEGARSPVDGPSHVEWLALLVMLGHDFLHPGTVNTFPAELESRSLAAMRPLMDQAGMVAQDRDRVAYCILRTDAACVAEHHRKVRELRFRLDDADCLAALVQEADILASALPETGADLTRALAHEWRHFNPQMADKLLQPQSRVYFLQNAALFSSPASHLIGLPAQTRREIDSLQATA